jgi:hypothetical protein
MAQAPMVTAAPAAPVPPVIPTEPAKKISPSVFGPVIERMLQARESGTNQFINLAAGEILTPSSEVASALAADQPGEDTSRFWEGLDVPQDSHRFQYVQWLRESGADLMFGGDGKIIGFDGIFAVAHGNSSTNWDDWNSLTPQQARAAVDLVDWELRASKASAHGLPLPPAPANSGNYRPAMQLDSREYGGPVVSLLTHDQSVNWFFKTRTGQMGVLQIANFTDNPPAATIRYKLLKPAPTDKSLARDETQQASREVLNYRLEAASSISDSSQKDKPLASVATDAAMTGEVEVAKQALAQIDDQTTRDQTTQSVARLLAKRGLQKSALEIAKGITDSDLRDKTLAELAE